MKRVDGRTCARYHHSQRNETQRSERRTMKRLSAAQQAMLAALMLEPGGQAGMADDGSATITARGRKMGSLSTMNALIRRGFAEHNGHWTFRITDSGRAHPAVNHYYPNVPGLGNVAVSRHALARMEEWGVTQEQFTDVLHHPTKADVGEGPGIVWRERNGVRGR
jgi:hypothetical protein